MSSIIVLFLISQCGPVPRHPAIVETGRFSPTVINGSVYETASVRLERGVRRITLPIGTHLARHDGGEMRLSVEKSQAYFGHTRECSSFVSKIIRMDLAIKRRRGTISIGMYGQGASFEGGYGMVLWATVPRDMEVRFSENLGGPTSVAARSRGGDGVNWWTEGVPARGWEPIDTDLATEEVVAGLRGGEP